MKDVLAVSIDGTCDSRGSAASFNRVLDSISGVDGLFLSTARPANLHHNATWVPIPPMDKHGYNWFCLYHLARYVGTDHSHTLTVQSDSGVRDSSMWDDRFLDYDYIGAPWPAGWAGQLPTVGNSGFCLRSVALLRETASITPEYPIWNGGRLSYPLDDVLTCINWRQRLEERGMSFAPLDVAGRFSEELPTPYNNGGKTFGYHEVQPETLQQARFLGII